jgi:two-component system phosphate regulon sensor histidine kinase PhoR
VKEIEKLAELLTRESDLLLAQWRKRVRELPSAARLDTPTLNDHIPMMIAEIAKAMEAAKVEADPDVLIESSPPAHGLQRFEAGFDIEEIVAEYNILRECIHNLADSLGIAMQGKPFRILNRVLDDAIGLAVKTFATYQALEVRRRREEYLAFVAHDLRTPLNAISLVTSILELRLRNVGGDTATMVKTLRRNVGHLDELVGSVMKENSHLLTELAIKLERRSFDLWPMVEGLIKDVEPIAGKGATLIVNEVPSDLSVRADAGLLRRVLQNLLANAIEYTPGGKVVIGASEDLPDAPVKIWVSDNGTGIPADRLDKVFEPLETNPDGDGNGLGLAIVKTFVEAHDGKVELESREGRGSTFRFTLPRSAVPKPPAAASAVENREQVAKL